MVIAALEGRGGVALVDAGWREKRVSQVLARPQFLPTRCQSMRCGGGKFMLSRNTPLLAHTHTHTHINAFLSFSSSPSLSFSLFLRSFSSFSFLFLSFFLSALFFIPFILDEERRGGTVGYDGRDGYACSQVVCPLELRTIVVERGEGKKSVDDSVKGSWRVGREEVGNIERVEWIVVTNRERYVEEPIIFFLSRARNAME